MAWLACGDHMVGNASKLPSITNLQRSEVPAQRPTSSQGLKSYELAESARAPSSCSTDDEHPADHAALYEASSDSESEADDQEEAREICRSDFDFFLEALSNEQRAQLDRSSFHSDEFCLRIFRKMDKDNSGLLEAKELERVIAYLVPEPHEGIRILGTEIAPLSVKSILAAFGKDSNGAMSAEEFPGFVRFCYAWKKHQEKLAMPAAFNVPSTRGRVANVSLATTWTTGSGHKRSLPLSRPASRGIETNRFSDRRPATSRPSSEGSDTTQSLQSYRRRPSLPSLSRPSSRDEALESTPSDACGAAHRLVRSASQTGGCLSRLPHPEGSGGASRAKKALGRGSSEGFEQNLDLLEQLVDLQSSNYARGPSATPATSQSPRFPASKDREESRKPSIDTESRKPSIDTHDGPVSSGGSRPGTSHSLHPGRKRTRSRCKDFESEQMDALHSLLKYFGSSKKSLPDVLDALLRDLMGADGNHAVSQDMLSEVCAAVLSGSSPVPGTPQFGPTLTPNHNSSVPTTPAASNANFSDDLRGNSKSVVKPASDGATLVNRAAQAVALLATRMEVRLPYLIGQILWNHRTAEPLQHSAHQPVVEDPRWVAFAPDVSNDIMGRCKTVFNKLCEHDDFRMKLPKWRKVMELITMNPVLRTRVRRSDAERLFYGEVARHAGISRSSLTRKEFLLLLMKTAETMQAHPLMVFLAVGSHAEFLPKAKADRRSGNP